MKRFFSPQDIEDYEQEKLIQSIVPNSGIEFRHMTKSGKSKTTLVKANLHLDEKVSSEVDAPLHEIISGGDARDDLERETKHFDLAPDFPILLRITLKLHFQWGMTYAELADILGMSKLTISQMLDQAVYLQKQRVLSESISPKTQTSTGGSQAASGKKQKMVSKSVDRKKESTLGEKSFKKKIRDVTFDAW